MSEEFNKYIDALSKLRFGKMFRNDFFLTWEKTDDEIKAVLIVADILSNLRERNISTKVFDLVWEFRSSRITRRERDSLLLRPAIFVGLGFRVSTRRNRRSLTAKLSAKPQT